VEIRASWEQGLRKAISTLPQVSFAPPKEQHGVAFTRDP
jgi:hypothetical protein